MSNTAIGLEPASRKLSSDQSVNPARVRLVESLLVLLMLVGAVLPMTHKPEAATSRAEAIMPEYVNEGIRYRDAEAGAFIARDSSN